MKRLVICIGAACFLLVFCISTFATDAKEVKNEIVKTVEATKDAIVRDAKAMKEDIPKSLKETKNAAVKQSREIKESATKEFKEIRDNMTNPKLTPKSGSK